MKRSYDTAIIGGGLAGLAAATQLARLGSTCAVFERSDGLGGRARTDREAGYAFNVGPHALYRKKAGEQFLQELAIPIPGHRVSAAGSYALDGEQLHALPGGFVSLLTTGALDLGGKVELARVMTSLLALDPRTLEGRSTTEWLATIKDLHARRVIAAITRVATYTAAQDRLSAAVAADQLKTAAFDGVTYVDGGWRSIVDGLEAAATAAGVEIVRGARVEAISTENGHVAGLIAGGETIAARAVLIAAGGPDIAARLSGSDSLAAFAARAVPIKAAVLDVALDCRINPKVKFVCGLDRPTYFSVASDSADVAPAGGSLVSAMLYLTPEDAHDAKAHEAELEAHLDRLQPGWRDHLVKKQHLPSITVAHALVVPGERRPPVAVPEVDGLFVAGDWVGDSGFLADASLASARGAAHAIAARVSVKAA